MYNFYSFVFDEANSSFFALSVGINPCGNWAIIVRMHACKSENASIKLEIVSMPSECGGVLYECEWTFCGTERMHKSSLCE